MYVHRYKYVGMLYFRKLWVSFLSYHCNFMNVLSLKFQNQGNGFACLPVQDIIEMKNVLTF